MKKQENLAENRNESVGNDEIAEYVAGIADRRTTARVLRAALADPATRSSLQTLTACDENARQAASADDVPSAEAARDGSLKARLRALAITVAREAEPVTNVPTAQTATEPLFLRLLERALQTGRALITLPCLAPATAASATTQSPLHRQTIQTGDGVRIEFQQLPGDPPYRLRAIVDASQIQPIADTEDTSPVAPYNVAYLTLEEGESGRVASAPAARHLLIVPLNAQTRGYADFVVGVAGPGGIPAPLSTCRLVSATLSQEPSALADGG